MCEKEWREVVETKSGKRLHDLLVDPIDGTILRADFIAHIDGHVTQVADHSVDFGQIVLHLVLPVVVGYSRLGGVECDEERVECDEERVKCG